MRTPPVFFRDTYLLKYLSDILDLPCHGDAMGERLPTPSPTETVDPHGGY